MTKARFIFAAMLPALIAACSTTHQSAPVVDRPLGTRPADAARQPASGRPAEGRGYYTVKRGDTLIQIALEFGQNYRDLVAWNNLANPNDIKVDQVLRVMPPEGTAQTGSIATSSGVEVRPLAPAPAPGANANVGTAPHKSAPRGDKLPYSDAALSDLQKPDGAPVPPVASASPKPEVQKSQEKAPDVPSTTGADDENIAWTWPAEGRIVGPFSEAKRGIDIAGSLGQPVVAAGAGKVLYAGSGIRGYGNLVIVKHSNNLLSAYAHNKTIFVKEDQNVTKGQKIAEMGSSDTDEVKLHFEIRQQGKPVDPFKFLPAR